MTDTTASLNTYRRRKRLSDDLRYTVYTLVYFALLCLVYRYFVVPQYGYMGFTADFKAGHLVLGICFCILIGAVLPHKEGDVGSFFLNYQMLVFYIPMTIYASFNENGNLLYLTLVTACFLLETVIIKVATPTPAFRKNTSEYSADELNYIFAAQRKCEEWLILCMLIVAIIVVIASAVFVRMPTFAAFNLNNVYVIRSGNSIGTALSYLSNWETKIILPFCFAWSINKKKYVMAILTIALLIVMYMIYAHKTYFFITAVLTGIYFFSQNKCLIKGMYVLLIIGIAALFVLYLATDTFTILNLAVRRWMFIPAQLKFTYYEFFTSNPKVYYADGIIGRILGITSSYDTSIQFTISAFLNEPGSSANTGYWGNSFANLGTVGVILSSVICAFYVRAVNSLGRDISPSVVISASAFSLIMLNDTALTTNMLTGGMFLLLIILFAIRSFHDEAWRERKKPDGVGALKLPIDDECSSDRNKVQVPDVGAGGLLQNGAPQPDAVADECSLPEEDDTVVKVVPEPSMGIGAIIKALIVKLKKSGFFSIIVSQVAVKVIAFCNSIVLARLLSKADYGIYSYAFNILSVLLLLDGIGSISSLIQHASEEYKNPSKQAAYGAFGFKIGILFNLVLCIGILLYAAVIPLSVSGAKVVLMIMSFQPLFSYFQNFCASNLRFRLENKMYSIMNIVAAIFNICAVVIGALAGGVVGVIIGLYIGYTLTGVAYMIAFRFIPNIYKDISPLAPKEKKSFIKLCLSASVNDSVMHLIMVADLFIIGIMISDAEIIASYKVATIIPTALLFIPSSIMIFAYPYLARNKDNIGWLKKALALIVGSLTIINTVLVAILLIWSPFFIKLIYGAQYLDAVTPFRLLLVGYLFTGTIRTPLVNFLWSQKKNMYVITIAAVIGVANIVMDILFIRWQGVNGAATATALTYVIAAVLSAVMTLVQFKKKKRAEQSVEKAEDEDTLNMKPDLENFGDTEDENNGGQ